MSPNDLIGGPNATYRQEQVPPAPLAIPAASMRLGRMLRLYVAATEGLTQKRVAQVSGVNESTVSRFLSGEQMPDGRAFAALLAYCLGEHGAP